MKRCVKWEKYAIGSPKKGRGGDEVIDLMKHGVTSLSGITREPNVMKHVDATSQMNCGFI